MELFNTIKIYFLMYFMRIVCADDYYDNMTEMEDDMAGPAFRIIGGTEANREDWTFIATLGHHQNANECGASLLAPDCLLTAAHCVTEDENGDDSWRPVDFSKYWARAGAYDIKYNEGQKIGIANLFIYPTFNRKELIDDVALVKLQMPFDLSENITLVKLASVRPKPGTKCVTAGWGDLIMNRRLSDEMNEDEMSQDEISKDEMSKRNYYPDAPPNYEGGSHVGQYPERLMEVTLPVITNRKCAKLYAHYGVVRNSMLCTMIKEGGQDACQGDSGGPLMCDGVQSGITSWGEGCGRPNTPGVFTDVVYFKEFINNGCQNGFAGDPAGKSFQSKLTRSSNVQINIISRALWFTPLIFCLRLVI